MLLLTVTIEQVLLNSLVLNWYITIIIIIIEVVEYPFLDVPVCFQTDAQTLRQVNESLVRSQNERVKVRHRELRHSPITVWHSAYKYVITPISAFQTGESLTVFWMSTKFTFYNALWQLSLTSAQRCWPCTSAERWPASWGMCTFCAGRFSLQFHRPI